MIDKVTQLDVRPAYPRLALAALTGRLRGTLVQPGDAEYAVARGVFIASDHTPAGIVRCADASDVAAALAFARTSGLPLAIRSGGHSLAGHGTIDGGLVVDLLSMKAIDLDLERGRARIEPGCTAGELAAHLQPYGLALTTGDAASVGIGGLTLGGGIGWMVRKYGLTIDRLRSVDLVTAEGHHLRVSAEDHPDLFWGLRGGGGNFGVATAFEFDLHPGGAVLGGAVVYGAANVGALLAAYSQYASTAPDELSTQATIMRAPPLPFLPPTLHGTPVLSISVCYAGDPEEGRRVLAPLRQLETPVADMIAPMPYARLFTEGGPMRGLRQRGRSMFLDQLDGDIFVTIAAHALDLPAPMSVAQLRILGGALSRVPVAATAFAHRDKPAMLTIVSAWSDPGPANRQVAWTDRFWAAMRSHASGAYANFLGNEPERIHDAYPPATHARLAALKRRYDPHNLVRHNQNIAPTID